MGKYNAIRNGDRCKVEVECLHGCGKKFELDVATKDLVAWRNGTLIQNAMPYLTPDQRELLITNTCGECWNKMFPPEPEEKKNEEEQIYPPKVFNAEGREIEYDLYNTTKAHKKIGDILMHWAGAPGTGYVKYQITRIDDTGVYGIEIENTIRELDPSEVE